ncbi:MAG: thioredoxin [Chloroflexota bacterium]
MMTPDFIIEVNEADFEYQVLTYSQQTPVVVDFWAEWCAPCRVLGPMLERLANEAQGGFRLAKVNVDANQNLAIRYGVRSIPAVKAFRNGQVIAEFVGVQPEERLRQFLREIAPSPNDLLLEKGFSLLDMQKAEQAETAFRKLLEEAPENSQALLGLARSLLMQGLGREANTILANFPTSREYSKAEMLRPLSQALSQVETADYPESDEPLEAAFYNTLRLVRRGNLEAAMDGLLDILRQDKHYSDGRARLVMVALLEMMGDNHPITPQYRRELASVLF